MDRHVVVTGGGGGIGFAIAAAFHRDGARVTLMGRNAEKLAAAARTLGGVAWRVCDVTHDDDVAEAFAAAGPAQVLVNNAGAVHAAPFERTGMSAWREALDVNLLGSVRTIQAAAPDMRRAGFGRIINIASTASLKGYPYVSAYVAAKHGLLGLTRALALEFARAGVTVNALCPGYVDTEIVWSAANQIAVRTGRTADEARTTLAAANPQQRLIEPDEVAAAALWLASAGAGGVNGAAIAISGGEI